MMKYVDVVVPLPVSGTFTYAVPSEWEDKVRIGMRVVVPFGNKKLYTGIIAVIHSLRPLQYEAREIVELPDEYPVLRRPQYKFWEWISEYYMCTVGEVYQAAVPSGLKLESETEVRINPDYESIVLLKDNEQILLDALSDEKAHSITELIKTTGILNVMPIVRSLLEKGAVVVNELLTEKFRPKVESYLKLSNEYSQEENLKKLFDVLSRAPKQLELLMRYIDLSGYLRNGQPSEIPKKDFIAKISAGSGVINTMIAKGIFEVYSKEVGRLNDSGQEIKSARILNLFQKEALISIEKQFVNKSVVLLHGVTSSGKTELYIHLINKVLAEGRQILYLVPEIALTTQLTTRLKRVFGPKLGVYHSKFSDAERVEIWNNVLNNTSYEVILGVRSSIFLPFHHLGLIIVDEEHEQSFKQYDPAPRYHARNAAVMLASMHGAKTLLGTATPSIETYYNAKTGKYGLVELHQRHEEIQLPEIEIVDMKEAYRKKQHEGHLSDVLIEKIRLALRRKEQVILFQNRRGYAPFVECKACAYIPKCKNCDVSLTLHIAFNTLSCHYCGYTERLPERCPACDTPALSSKGFGTEKIEEEVLRLFPDARVQRMDMDTTRNKKSYEKIIADVENEKIDILIGTQMVTKGLDFQKVSLVGILNADNLLNFPDFRAHERAFQLMAQVSGRAGRKFKRGQVIIQSSFPDHPVIAQVLKYDYDAMYSLQIGERKQFRYPPYYRMIEISLKHKDLLVLNDAVREMAHEMRAVFGDRVLGPVVPVISRIRNLFIRQFILKIENEASLVKAKEYLGDITGRILSKSAFRGVKISHDVDPY
ncbi:MAG: primosomal protein N' [Paludibacter sp.]|nr:primosomal protein N' [Paludibacter sp.]